MRTRCTPVARNGGHPSGSIIFYARRAQKKLVLRTSVAAAVGHGSRSHSHALLGQGSSSTACSAATPATELLELLLEDREEFSRKKELVRDLVATPVPFRTSMLEAGPWVVRFVSGNPLLWSATYQFARLLSKSASASQDIDGGSSRAVSRVDCFGGQVAITAEGKFALPAEEGAQTSTPVGPITVTVQRGALKAFGREWQLPIRGTGQFSVLYIDSGLRILQSVGGSTVTVQVKGSLLK